MPPSTPSDPALILALLRNSRVSRTALALYAVLVEYPNISIADAARNLGRTPKHVEELAQSLIREGLVHRSMTSYSDREDVVTQWYFPQSSSQKAKAS